MDAEIRNPGADELDAVVATVETSWGYHAGPEEREDARALADLGRTWVAFEGTAPVGVAAALAFELTMPGGAAVAVSGLTEVGVLPTHRRRGLLSALMARHLDDCRARGEVASVLIASEAAIYPRFGYGPAVTAQSATIDPRRAAFAPTAPGQSGRMTLLGPEDAAAVAPAVYDAYRRSQPGEVSRSPAYWDVLLRDRERWRDGAGPRFVAAHEGGGGFDGYAFYRVKAGWPLGLPAFEMSVEEVVATTAEARAALWRYLLGVDLVVSLDAWSLPTDEPLRSMLADPRALGVTAVRDLLWARLCDVGAALASRAYGGPGAALVLDVTGEGRLRLDAGPSGAECRPAPAAVADLSVAAADLAAAWLGATSWTVLARAGRAVEHTAGAVERAARLFATDPPPHSVTDF